MKPSFTVLCSSPLSSHETDFLSFGEAVSEAKRLADSVTSGTITIYRDTVPVYRLRKDGGAWKREL